MVCNWLKIINFLSFMSRGSVFVCMLFSKHYELFYLKDNIVLFDSMIHKFHFFPSERDLVVTKAFKDYEVMKGSAYHYTVRN